MLRSRYTRRGGLFLTAMVFLVANSCPYGDTCGQLTSSSKVTVLPFLSGPADSTLADEVRTGFLLGLRPGLGLRIEATGAQDLRGPHLKEMLASANALGDYSQDSGSAFLVGGVVHRTPDGGLEVASVVYGQDDQAIRAVVVQTIPQGSPGNAGNELGRRLSQPRYFSPADTPFFYSLLVPGAGQLSMGYPGHALAAVVMVAAPLAYGLATPDPDPFVIDFGYYVRRWNYITRDYDYYLGGDQVSESIYLEALGIAQDHARAAASERDAAKTRRRVATGLAVLGYVLNVADTLFLSRRRVDASPFFEILDRIELDWSASGPVTARAGLRIPIRF